ncbi:MAG TPA: MFS transporter [Sphingomonas sp.]
MSNMAAASTGAKTGLRGLSRMQWIILAIAVAGELLLTADIYAFAALVPFLSKDLGISPGKVGFIQGSFALTYCIGLMLWSPLSRRLSSRALYVTGLATIGAGVLVQALIPNLMVLLAARLFIGFFEGAVWLGIMKMVVEWFEPAQRGMVNGLILAACSVAITLDFALGIPIAGALGWEAFFIGVGVITLATTVVSFLALRPGPFAAEDDGEAAAHAPVTLLFRSRWLYIGSLAIFGDTFALNATATWAVPAFVQVQGMSIGYGAVLGSLMGLSQVFFLVLGGWLSDRTTRLTVIIGGAVLGCISAMLFTTATFVAVPFAVLVGAVLLSGVAVFSGGAIMSMLSERFPTALAPAATGYSQFASFLSNFFAPATMGAAIEAGGSFGSAFLIFLAVEILVMIGVFALMWRLDKRPVATLATA